MKGYLIAAAIGLGLLGASVPTAGSALAWDKADHRAYKGPVYKFVGVWLYGAPHHHTRPSYRRGRHDVDWCRAGVHPQGRRGRHRGAGGMRRGINPQPSALSVTAPTQSGLVAGGSFSPVDTLRIPVLDCPCL